MQTMKCTVSTKRVVVRPYVNESALEKTLAMHLTAARIPFSREVQPFFPVRKFRFDFLVGEAIHAGKGILVECEGQIWQKGGHSSGTGITRDIIKANLCTIHGLRLLRFTREMIEDGSALKTIEQALKGADGSNNDE